MNVIYEGLLSKNRNKNVCFYTGCSVMYIADFSEQRQRKQRKSGREKVSIEETQFRAFNTYNLISSVYRPIYVYRRCSVLILIGA